MELGEGDNVALRCVWLPVVRRWCDPLRLHQGSTRVQEPLLLQIPQSALRHERWAPDVGGDEPHRHLVWMWRATLWISPLKGMMCRRCAGKCRRARAMAIGGMRKRRQPDDPPIFIDTSQWVDPTNAVTSQINVPPNGLISLSNRTLRILPTDQRRNSSLLKRRAQRARKRTATTLPSVAR